VGDVRHQADVIFVEARSLYNTPQNLDNTAKNLLSS
jgi:hypothetical protein